MNRGTYRDEIFREHVYLDNL